MTNAAITLFVNSHDAMIGLSAGLAAVAVIVFLFWIDEGSTA